MTSEERAKQFLDQAEPTLYAYDLEFLTSQFDQHAAEARAEQRQDCARKSKKVIDEYFRTSGHNKMMQGRIENACLNATGESDE